MQVELAKVPEAASVHEETSVWPLLLAASLSLFCGILPFSARWSLVALLPVLASVMGWTWSNLLRAPPEEGGIGGHSRLWWGMVLVIVSEAGLFLTGFLAFTAHPSALGPDAPAAFRDLNRPLTFVASLVLWSSGFVGAWALKRHERQDRKGFLVGLGVTLLLGVLFVGYQGFEYARLFSEGFTLTSGGAGAIFYFLTGLHGLHVVGGLLALGVFAVLGARRRLGASRTPALRAAMLYWHFVDAAWVAIYAVLYLKLF